MEGAGSKDWPDRKCGKGSRWPWKSKGLGDYFLRKAQGFSTLSLPKLWLDAQEGWPRSLRLRSRPTQRPDLSLLRTRKELNVWEGDGGLARPARVALQRDFHVPQLGSPRMTGSETW